MQYAIIGQWDGVLIKMLFCVYSQRELRWYESSDGEP